MSESFPIETITPENYTKATYSPGQIADFLCEQLDKYGDPRDEIMQCLHYALGITKNRRGFVLVAWGKNKKANSEKILGTVVVCETGMSGFVPENLLVYIAVDSGLRGQGLGKALMLKAMETARGDMALHVEPDNPARHVFEKIGFTNKYLEMRFGK